MKSRRVLFVSAILGLGVIAGCGVEEGDSSTVVPAAEPNAAPAVAEPVQQAGDTEMVNVYWGWTIETVAAGSPERVAAGGRSAGADAGPEFAVEALLDGPNAIETEIGMVTLIPSGTDLLGVSVAGGVATVDLTNDFNEGGGTTGEAMRFAQMVFTLTQFDTVDAVSFQIDGVDVTEIGTHGFDVSQPIGRDAFNGDVRPFILVEQPVPGADFSSGDRLMGESNTFEATLEYVVVDGEGLIIAEGFTTATDGNGNWGDFDVAVSYEPTVNTQGAIIVWESSPRDGTQQNLVEYPVTLDAATPPTTTSPTTVVPTTVNPEIPATR